MKISFVTTVYNEENTIEQLLFSLSQQTRKPDEIIFVDAGSTDKTVEKLRKVHRKGQQINWYVKKGNRAVGRNEGIKRASGEIVVVSDAGCLLDKDWIKYITEPYKKTEVDIVSGFYLPVTHSVFEKCLATYTCVMPDRINKEHYLPSSRSIAFRKSAWKRVGGYPEYLDTCEDLVFARALKRSGANFVFIRNATVYWPQRKNILQAFQQFFSYAKGDGQALYLRPQTPLLFVRVLGAMFVVSWTLGIIGKRSNAVLLTVILLGVLYGLWAIQKNYHYIHHVKALFWLPILQVVSDIAVFMGMSFGLLVRLKKML